MLKMQIDWFFTVEHFSLAINFALDITLPIAKAPIPTAPLMDTSIDLPAIRN
jgi:hypothetical protein